MLDTIAALKTNNARKIPNYDPSLLEHMKRLLRGSLRSNGKSPSLTDTCSFLVVATTGTCANLIVNQVLWTKGS